MESSCVYIQPGAGASESRLHRRGPKRTDCLRESPASARNSSPTMGDPVLAQPPRGGGGAGEWER
eukprot:2815698-Alexandrium_andersonii.AAC.1